MSSNIMELKQDTESCSGPSMTIEPSILNDNPQDKINKMTSTIMNTKQDSKSCLGKSSTQNTDKLYDNDLGKIQINKMQEQIIDNKASVSTSSNNKIAPISTIRRNYSLENELERINYNYHQIIIDFYKNKLKDNSVIDELAMEVNDLLQQHQVDINICGNHDTIIQSFRKLYKIRKNLMEKGKNIMTGAGALVDIEDTTTTTLLKIEGDYLITTSGAETRKYEIRNKEIAYLLLKTGNLNMRGTRAKFNNAIKNRSLIEVVSTSEICGIRLNYVRPTTEARRFEGKVTQIGNGKVATRNYGSGLVSKPRVKANLIKNLKNQVLCKKESLPSLTLPNTQVYQKCRYGCGFRMNMSVMDPNAINIFGDIVMGNPKYNVLEDYFSKQDFYLPLRTNAEQISCQLVGEATSFISPYDVIIVSALRINKHVRENKVLMNYRKRVMEHPHYNSLIKLSVDIKIYNTIIDKRSKEWNEHNQSCPGRYIELPDEQHEICSCGDILKNRWQVDHHICGDDDEDKRYDLMCYGYQGKSGIEDDDDWEEWMGDEPKIEKLPQPKGYLEYLKWGQLEDMEIQSKKTDVYFGDSKADIFEDKQDQDMDNYAQVNFFQKANDIIDVVHDVVSNKEKITSTLESLPSDIENKSKKIDSILLKTDNLVCDLNTRVKELDKVVEKTKSEIVATTIANFKQTMLDFLKEHGLKIKPSFITNVVVYIIDLIKSENFDSFMIFKTVNLVLNMIEDILGIIIPLTVNLTQTSPISTILGVFSCIRGLDFLAHKGWDLIKYIWSKFPKIFSGLRIHYGTSEDEKLNIIKDLSKQFAIYQNMKQIGESITSEIEKELVDKYEKYLIWTTHHIPFISSMYGSMRPLYESICTKRPTPTRVRPFFLVLEGLTRTGKSTFAHYLAKMFCSSIGVSENSVYTRNPGNEYWDGYHGQHVVIYDDFGQSTNPKEAYEIFQVVTNNAFIPPMAALTDSTVGMKGTYFTSPFIIACTNRTNLAGFQNVIVDQDALWNRVSLCFYMNRKTNDNGLDSYILTDVSPHRGKGTIFSKNSLIEDENNIIYEDDKATEYIFRYMTEYFKRMELLNTGMSDKFHGALNPELSRFFNIVQSDEVVDKERFHDTTEIMPPRYLTTDIKLPQGGIANFRDITLRSLKHGLNEDDRLLLGELFKLHKSNKLEYADELANMTPIIKIHIRQQNIPAILCDLIDHFRLIDGKRVMTLRPLDVEKLIISINTTEFSFLYTRGIHDYGFLPKEILLEYWDKTQPIRVYLKDLWFRFSRTTVFAAMKAVGLGLVMGISTVIPVIIITKIMMPSVDSQIALALTSGVYNDISIIENPNRKMIDIVKKIDKDKIDIIIGNIDIKDMILWNFVREKQRRNLDKNNAEGSMALLQKLHDNGMIQIVGDVKKIQSFMAVQKLDKIKKTKIGEDQNLSVLTGHKSLAPFKVDIHENQFDMQGTQMSVNDKDYPMAENLYKSMVKLTAMHKVDDMYKAQLSLFGLYLDIDRDNQETTYLIPGHFYDAIKTFNDRNIDTIHMSFGNGYSAFVSISNIRFIRYKDMDMCLMIWRHTGYSNINEPKSIEKFFVTQKQMEYVPSVFDAVLVRFHKDEKDVIRPVVKFLRARPVTTSSIDVSYCGNGKTYQILTGFTYETDCSVGDCGSILIGCGNFLNNKILGYHVMGSRNFSRGGAQAVVWDYFTKQYIQTNTNINNQMQIETLMETVSPMYNTFNQRKNNFEMTSFENEYTVKEPANLYQSEGCDPGIIGTLEHGMYQWYPKYIDVHNLIPYKWKAEKVSKEITWKTVLEGFGGMDAVNMQTSAGYPFTELHMTKKNFFNKLPDGSFEYDEKLIPYMDMFLSKFEIKPAPFITWTVGLKDELLKKDKLARVFSIPPFTYTLACRKVFGHWISMMHNNPITTGICVGMNPESVHWSQLYYSLREQPFLIDGDYTKWDKRLHGSIIHQAIKIINNWYDKNIQDGLNEVRFNLIERMYNTVLVYGNKLYRIRRGMMSGHVLTALVNSLCNKIVLVSAMQELLPPGFMVKYPLSKHVKFAIYGDDFLVTISPEYAMHINRIKLFNKITELYLVQCTISTKDDKEITPFAKWEDVTFLKRKFRIDNLRIVPLLEMSSIFSCLKYVRKSVFATTKEQFVTNIEVASRFLYFYGKEIYSHYKSILEKYTNFPTYRELNKLYENEGFNIMQCEILDKANMSICNFNLNNNMNQDNKNKKVILRDRLYTIFQNVKDNSYIIAGIIACFLLPTVLAQPSTTTSTTRTTMRQLFVGAFSAIGVNIITPYFQNFELEDFSFVNRTLHLITEMDRLNPNQVNIIGYSMIISMLGLILYKIYPRTRGDNIIQSGPESWSAIMDKEDKVIDELKVKDSDVASTTVENKGDGTIDNMMSDDFQQPTIVSVKIGGGVHGKVTSNSNITKTGTTSIGTTTREIVVDGKMCLFHPVYSRPVRVRNITYGIGNTAGSLLGRITFPDIATIIGQDPGVNITKNSYLKLMTDQNLFVNFDILLTFTINSTKLSCGSIIVGYCPNKTRTPNSYFGKDGTGVLPTLDTSLNSMFSRKYVILDTTRDGIYQMVVPWTVQTRYISKLHRFPISDSKAMDYFDVALVALTPFQTPTGAPATCDITVEATFINIECKGLTPMEVQSKLFGSDYTKIEYHLKDINNSALPMNVTGDSFTTDIKPELGLSAFGLDNPSDTRNLTRKSLFQRLWSYVNVVDAFRTVPQPNKIITFTRDDMRNLSCEVDEMSWDFIKSRENYVQGYTVSNTTAVNSLIGAIPLAPVMFSPLNMSFAAIPRPSGRPATVTPTTLGIFLKQFRHWRGSLEYNIYINANSLGSGKLLVAIHYGILPSQLQSLANIGALDGRSVTHMVIDLANPEFEHHIKVPFASTHEVLNLYQSSVANLTYDDDTCMGSLSFWMVGPSGVPTGMPGNVNLVITQKLGKDFVPLTQLDSRIMIAQTNLSQPLTTRAGKILNFVSKITSIKEMLVLPVKIGYFNLDNQTSSGNNRANGGLSLPMSPQYFARYSPIWNMVMTQYAGWRGSLRARITHLEGATVNVFWTPQRGGVYTDTDGDSGNPVLLTGQELDGYPEGSSSLTAPNDPFIMDKNIRSLGTFTGAGEAFTAGAVQLPTTYISTTSPETIIEVADPSPMGLAHSTYTLPFVYTNPMNSWNMRKDQRIQYVTCKLARLASAATTATVAVEVFAGDDFRVFWYSPHLVTHSVLGTTSTNTVALANYDRISGLVGTAAPEF